MSRSTNLSPGPRTERSPIVAAWPPSVRALPRKPRRVNQHSWLPLLLLAALGGAGALPACAAVQQSGFGSRPPRVTASPEIAKLERAMLELVNRDRRAAGLSPLEFDAELSNIARAHSLDMRDNGFFSHDSPTNGSLEDRLDAAGFLALEARENLASAATVERAEENILASPSHRANLESKTMTHVGIGIVPGDRFGDERMLTVTQVFALPATIESASDVARGVREAVRAARKKARIQQLQSQPMLDALAKQYVDEVPIDLDAAALERIGDDVASALEAEPGHGLKAVQLAAQVVIHTEQFETAGAPLDPKASKLGLAAAATRDARGRPQVKVLLLIGQ